ncbi:hypothetical protein DFH11DRAFT_1829300 [Phellopilus nigrolimitatus]|nr:hypothetical protein DFH11DRAFT_1829300 [Phellopilus nigrolimitatus]
MLYQNVALGVVSVILSGISLVEGQSGGTTGALIQNSNSRITYSPELCTSTNMADCVGAWWNTNLDDGTVVKTTAGPSSRYQNAQTTLTFPFRGTSLELHGFLDAAGANMILQLDNMTSMANTSSGMGGALRQPSVLANYTGLDADTVHTLTIGWFGNQAASGNSSAAYSFTYFDHFVVGGFRAVESTASATSGVSATTTPSASTKPLKARPGVIAGTVLAVLIFVTLFSVGSYCLLRHRRRFLRRYPSSQHIEIITDSQEDRPSDDPPSPASTILKASPHMSLPPAYLHAQRSTSAMYGNKHREGVSYLDLESGGRESSEDGAPASSEQTNEHTNSRRSSRRALFPVLPPKLVTPPSPGPRVSYPRVSYPPPARLTLNFRNRASTHIGGPAHSTMEQGELSPCTMYTSYHVDTATRTVARPQNAQLVVPGVQPNAGAGSSTADTGRDDASHPSLPPLPPLPPLPSPREEKKRLAQAYKASRNSRASKARAHGASTVQGGDSIRPPQDPGVLDTELVPSRERNASLDAMSVFAGVSVRSLPPPYVLHL